MASHKNELKVIEDAAHAILSPLGFKKQKLNWRRLLPETLQQFSFVSMRVGAWYRPEWGVNVLSLCKNLKPRAYELQASWTLEQFVRPRRKMLAISAALKLHEKMPAANRVKRVSELLDQHVIPCFESHRTLKAIRLMVGRYDAPLRAQSIGDLPEEWLPKDWGT